MKSYLRVKIKSLAAEARIIRHDELHWRSRTRHQRRIGAPNLRRSEANFWGLRQHRHELCVEQRSALLAYGFLRGRPYAKIEPNPRWKRQIKSASPNWRRVSELIVKYGEGAFPDRDAARAAVDVWANDNQAETKAA